MKDIFIDTNIAKSFASPISSHYKMLIQWLITYNNDSDDAFLVLSKKLYNEYVDSCKNCIKPNCIVLIVEKLRREGRLNNFSNKQIKQFSNTYFRPVVLRNLRSNQKDRYHIQIVLLSSRKIALTKDVNFTYDLTHFPRFRATVADCPSKISYI